MLKVENVTKYYDNFRAVHDLSFEIEEGEIFGLLGVNGAGKTTTFRMIMGLLDMSEGNITLDGKKINYKVTDKIGFLTEERSLLPSKTVYEQAVYYGVLKGLSEEVVNERLDEYLKRFEVEDYKYKKIKELSKGNQQKIQFITAILNEPKLLILDEPFSGLDPFNIELFKNEILELSKKGSMIIFSSHRMEHVELFCKKLVVLVNGRTVLEGNIKNIKENYQKKNIILKADIDKEKLSKIEGVEEIIEKSDEYEIRISSKDVTDKIFKYVSTCKKVVKFVVEEPSLNEIFISKVGESYEK